MASLAPQASDRVFLLEPLPLKPLKPGLADLVTCPGLRMSCVWIRCWSTYNGSFGGKINLGLPWRYIWSNYSDLKRPHPKWWFSKGNPLISGKSRLVKYYNLARYITVQDFIWFSIVSVILYWGLFHPWWNHQIFSMVVSGSRKRW